MHITERKTQDVVVLDLKGRMTIDDGADLLQDKFKSLIFTGHSKVLLNMGAVPHIDSGALGTLVRSEEHTSELQSPECISYAVFPGEIGRASCRERVSECV